MSIKLGVVMDPLATLAIKKDTSLAMLREAQSRGWEIHYFEQADLYLEAGQVMARSRGLRLDLDSQPWYHLEQAIDLPLSSLDVVLMRKDPPFDMEYIYTTYLLELAEAQGLLVVNRPQSLRDANEKLFTAWFPDCVPATLVCRDMARIKQFLATHQDIIVKPLAGMGGASIFRLRLGDPNTNVILETMTEHGRRTVMAQRFIPEIAQGDKRIIVIDGEPVAYALARIPPAGETRGNLAVGGKGEGRPLTERDRWLCRQIAPVLQAKGLLFVGLDVIGDYITEINVTSPTGVRELDNQFQINISAILLDRIEQKLNR